MAPAEIPSGPAAGGARESQPAYRRGRRATLAWLRAVVVLACVVAIDQLTKHLVEHSIVQGEERKVLPGVQLVDTRNRGVAFGFFPGNHVAVTVLIALAVLVLLGYFASHATRALIWLPTGMIAGGALGNVLDRLRHGSVTDFIKLPLGWPPFNLADSSITIGVLILFVVIDRARNPQQRARAQRP
jgi:signal peptidase II